MTRKTARILFILSFTLVLLLTATGQSTAQDSDVEIVSWDVPSQVDIDEDATATVRVSNRGDSVVEVTGTIMIGVGSVSDPVEIPPGSTRVIEIPIYGRETGSYDYYIDINEVDSRDLLDSTSDNPGSIEFVGPEVSIVGWDVPSEIEIGSDTTGSVRVRNQGNQEVRVEGILNVKEDTGERGTNSDSIVLSPRETRSIELPIDTHPRDVETGVHEYYIEVSPETSGASGAILDTTSEDTFEMVEASDPAEFEVTSTNFETSTNPGDTVQATARVENIGEESQSVNAQYVFDGEVKGNDRTATLAGGGSERVSFSYTLPDSISEGTYTQRIRTGDDTATDSITIESDDEPANLEVRNPQFETSANPGDTVQTSATILNVGEESDSGNIQYLFDDNVEDFDSVRLSGQDSQTVTFSYTVPDSVDEGSYQQTIRTGDDRATESITIESDDEPGTLEITDFDMDTQAEAGDTVQAEAVVENTGEETGSRTVEYRVGNNVEDTEDVSVEGGSTESISLTYSVDSEGEYTQEIRTGDDTVSRTLSVSADETDGEDSSAGRETSTSDDGNEDLNNQENSGPVTQRWEDRTFLPGGTTVPVDNLNDPMTLTILGMVLSVLGIVFQMSPRF